MRHYEIPRFVLANDYGTGILLDEILRRSDRIQKLIVASSMSIYGESAYRCETCRIEVYPQLRDNEQLAKHEWEFTCKTCGSLLEFCNTREDKPLFPTTVYAVNKWAQEQYCLTVGRAYKIPTVALHYFNIQGTRQFLSNPYTGICAIFSSRLLNNEQPLIFEGGEQTRDFVHVSDIVQANLLALEIDKADNEAINIGTDRAFKVREIAETLAKGLGKEIMPEISKKYREGNIRHCRADITKGRNLLGYESKVKLEEGLNELLKWVKYQTPSDKVTTATAELAAQNLVR